MELSVNVLGHRNLSHSNLILKNLYSTLQVGSDAHSSAQVESEPVTFHAGGLHETVSITLRNRQTQTVMFIRNVPLSIVPESEQATALWINMYPPGDPRDLNFDGSQPRPDVAQVQLCLRSVSSRDPSPPPAQPLQLPRQGVRATWGGSGSSFQASFQRAFGGGSGAADEVSPIAAVPRASMPLGTTGAGAVLGGGRSSGAGSSYLLGPSRSTLGSSSASVEAELRSPPVAAQPPPASGEVAIISARVEEMKRRISAASDAQLQAESENQQLQKIRSEVEEHRGILAKVDEELRVAVAQRGGLERKKQDATQSIDCLRELLEQRDASIVELRRLEADEQHEQLTAERERRRAEMDQAMVSQQEHMRTLGAELDLRRGEAEEMSEALKSCDRRIAELQEAAAGAGAGAAALEAAGSEAGRELGLLRAQLAEAVSELERLRGEDEAQSRDAAASQDASRADRERIRQVEAAAAEARAELEARQALAAEDARRAAELRLDAEAAEREVALQANRAAQLDGQVSENRNQIRDLENCAREAEAEVERCERLQDAGRAEVANLQERVTAQESEGERLAAASLSLAERLGKAGPETLLHREKAVELRRKLEESEASQSRKRVELDTTRRVLETVIKNATEEADRLSQAQVSKEGEVMNLEAEAEECGQQLADSEAKAEEAVSELQRLMGEQAARCKAREQVEERLGACGSELVAVQDRLADVSEEMESDIATAQASIAERRLRQAESREQLEHLEAEMQTTRDSEEVVNRQLAAAHASLAEEQGSSLGWWTEQAALEQEASQLGEEQERAGERLAELRGEHSAQQARLAELQEVVACQSAGLEEVGGREAAKAQHEAELRSDLESRRSQLDETMVKTRRFSADAEACRDQAVSELAELQARHEALRAEHSRLAEAAVQASQSLQTVHQAQEASLAELASQVAAAEAELSRAGADEARLDGETSGLEESLAVDEAEAVRLDAELVQLEATLAAQRADKAMAEEALCRHVVELEVEQLGQEETSEQLAQQQAKVEALRSRDEVLRAEVTPEVEDASRCLPDLRAEVAAAEKRLSGSVEEHRRLLGAQAEELEGTRLVAVRTLEDQQSDKHRELEGCSAHRAALQQEARALGDELEERRRRRDALRENLGREEAGEQGVKAQLASELLRTSELQEEHRSLEQQRDHLEAKALADEQSIGPAKEEAEKCCAEVEELWAKLEALRAEAEAAAAAQPPARLAASAGAEAAQLGEAAAAAAAARGALAEAEAQKEAAEEDASAMEARVEALRGKLLQVRGGRPEAGQDSSRSPVPPNGVLGHFAATSADDDERMIALFKGQIHDILEMEARAKVEAGVLDSIKVDMNAELEKLREDCKSLTDTLTHHVEHSNLQHTTAEQLEKEVSRIEADTEDLVMGLHEQAVQGEALQQEYDLLKSKADGNFSGSMEDFANEIFAVRRSGEQERHQDELARWKQVVQTAEQDISMNSPDEKHAKAEVDLREKLDALLAELAAKEDDFEKRFPEVTGSVHSLPPSLHGLVASSRLARPQDLPGRRKAVVIGCSCTGSHAPLAGCGSDAWNMQCLLRHSLQFREDEVLNLIECTDSCPTPASRQPTKANILASLRWLARDALPGDRLFFFFSGYSAEVPVRECDGGTFQACLIPVDFAEDLPSNFFQAGVAPVLPDVAHGSSYRLVPFAEITAALGTLPKQCKVTIVLDCGYGAVPHVAGAPFFTQHSKPDVPPDDVIDTKSGTTRLWRPRLLQLPPLPAPAAVISTNPGPPPQCRCHCYSACSSVQWCAELPIEGCVQGAFTWAFVKAFTAGHLNTTVGKHMDALHSILGNLRAHFRWLDQTPQLQSSGSAETSDVVLEE